MGKIYTLSNTDSLESDNFHYTMTSPMCPEQYDVYDINNPTDIVAYIRLRWGCLRVYCPDYDGELVFECEFAEDEYLGTFPSENERLETFSHIDDVLCKYYKKK